MSKRSIFILIPVFAATAWLGYEYAYKNEERAADLFNESRHYRAIGELDKGERLLLKAIRVSPKPNSFYYRALGHHYYRMHRCQKAVDAYNHAIEADPRIEPKIIIYQAQCYAELGKIYTAFDKIIRIKRSFPKQFDGQAEDLFENLKQIAYGIRHPEDGNVHLKIVLPPELHHPPEVWVGGNWTREHKFSDAYGWSYGKASLDGDHYDFSTQLPPFTDLPYQAVVKDPSGKPLVFGRFKLEQQQSGYVIPIDRPVPDRPFFASDHVTTLQRPVHGHDTEHRVFILWIDCGSWWFVRSLIERGFLPNFRDMMENGTYAEMDSNPPFTSVAIKRVTAFSQDETFSIWNLFWIQLKSLQVFDRFIEIHENQAKSLAGFFRQQGLRFVNLTFNEPYLGDKSDDSGYFGFVPAEYLQYRFDPLKSTIAPESPMRAYVDVPKLDEFLNEKDRYGKWLLSSQWDDTDKKIRMATSLFNGVERPQVMLLRLPGVDVLSHYFFENSAAVSYNNRFLETFYGYIDDQLGRIRSMLDSNDTLFVISDHGILTHVRHHRTAMFMAEGPLFPSGMAAEPFPIQQFPYIVRSLVVDRALSPVIHGQRSKTGPFFPAHPAPKRNLAAAPVAVSRAAK